MRGNGSRCSSSDVRGNGSRCVNGDVPRSRDQYVRGNARGDRSRCASSDGRGSGGRCASSDVRGNSGRCVSSGVRECGDPGGGPEPEADYEPPGGKLLGVPDEILVLNRATEARMPDPADMRAQEVPGKQTTMATAASVGEQVQKTERLYNQHRSPPIMWEGGEDESALKDTWKQFAAQQVPSQLRSTFQPEPRREASGAERPREPIQGKVSGPPTIKTRESIMLADGELCSDREDAMHDSRQAVPPKETAAGVRAMPPTDAVRGRRRTGQLAEVAEALIPSPAGEDSHAARNGRPTTSGMSAGATAATADKDEPVAPLPGESAPMKAETRVPHLADLLALQVPSQGILEAVAATSRDQAPRTVGSAAQCELQHSGNEKSGDEPPLGGLWKGTDETGQQGRNTRPCRANQSAPEHEAARAAHPDELKPGLQIRRLWRQRNVIRRPAEKLSPRNFLSGGALWGSSRCSIRRRLAGRLAPRTFPNGGALWSLKTDAGGEMRRPIIKAAVEEALQQERPRRMRQERRRQEEGSVHNGYCTVHTVLHYTKLQQGRVGAKERGYPIFYSMYCLWVSIYSLCQKMAAKF